MRQRAIADRSCLFRYCTGLGTVLMVLQFAAAHGQIGGRKSPEPGPTQPKADARVLRALADAKLKYSVNKFGDCELLFSLDDDRTQVVFVNSETEHWGEMEIRSVWAFGYLSKTRLSQAKLERLLKQNGKLKSGAWHLSDGETIGAVFSVKVAADCDGNALRTVATGVAEQADEMEKLLTSGSDEY